MYRKVHQERGLRFLSAIIPLVFHQPLCSLGILYQRIRVKVNNFSYLCPYKRSDFLDLEHLPTNKQPLLCYAPHPEGCFFIRVNPSLPSVHHRTKPLQVPDGQGTFSQKSLSSPLKQPCPGNNTFPGNLSSAY